MRKSSLGMRKSNAAAAARRPSHNTLAAPLSCSSSQRKSGIPVRSRSSETTCMSADGHDRSRAKSSSRYELATPGYSRSAMTPFTPSQRRITIDRLSRSTTKNVSVNQSRRSSAGGAKSRTDDRPLKDKEWQHSAQMKVESVLRQDPEGAQLLDSHNSNGTIKPLSLSLFIDLTNYFIKYLEPSLSIDKQNYIAEITYFCKRFSYRGRVDKSWLISVNTQHSYSHALGLLDFLASLVSMCNPPSINDLLFPINQLDEEDESFWDFKLIIPLMNDLYTCENEQEKNELIFDCIKAHTDAEIDVKIEQAEAELKNFNEAYERLAAAIEKTNAEGMKSSEKLNELMVQLESEMMQSEDYKDRIAKVEENHQIQIASLEALENELSALNKEKEKIENAVKNQKISSKDVENIKKNMSKVSQQCQTEKKNITELEEEMFKADLKLNSLKKEALKDSQELNALLIKCGATEPSIVRCVSSQFDITESLEPITLALTSSLEKYNNLRKEIEKDLKDTHQTLTQIKNYLRESQKEKQKLESKHASLQEELNALKKDENLDELLESNKKLRIQLEKQKEESRIYCEMKEKECDEKLDLFTKKDNEHQIMKNRAMQLFASYNDALDKLNFQLNSLNKRRGRIAKINI